MAEIERLVYTSRTPAWLNKKNHVIIEPRIHEVSNFATLVNIAVNMPTFSAANTEDYAT